MSLEARLAAEGGIRGWAARIGRSWNSSLRFRTTATAVSLTAIAVLVSFVVMSFVIQNYLFTSRYEQVASDARRSSEAAQDLLNRADLAGGRSTLLSTLQTMNQDLIERSASDQGAMQRIDTDVPVDNVWQDRVWGDLDGDIITADLRAQVQDKPDGMWWQSTQITQDGQPVPAIIIGRQLDLPEYGAYALYLVYDLSAASQTLGFLQLMLWIAGLLLLVVVGLISWFVVRQVAAPVAQTALTSARFAGGDLGVRVQVRGDDEIAALGRSFNAMADSLEAQIKELADLSLVQQRFVSDVSHELRTPLTTIKLAADMLNMQREDFDPVTARSAELLQTQVERFEVLLTDLLEISRYDAGSVQLELEPTSVAQLAEDCIEGMQQLAEQRGSDLRLVAPGGYSPIDIDPRRIRRIVRNLLGNAIEHGEGRPVVVTVDSDQHVVALGVRDYGIGMNPEDAERVFDRFWRADPSRKRTIGGTGLGLSIALGDAKLHHGTLEVWSRPGEGTNFVLVLPRDGETLSTLSPVPLEPSDAGAALEQLGITQPILVAGLTSAVAKKSTAQEEPSS